MKISDNQRDNIFPSRFVQSGDKLSSKFSKIWSRQSLSMRERRLITLSFIFARDKLADALPKGSFIPSVGRCGKIDDLAGAK